MASGNPYGFDIANTDNDNRFVEKDYSIGGGVTMKRQDFEHGFFSAVGARRGEHFGKGPRNWKRSDESIREEACEALWYNPLVDASDIEVSVDGGVVSLNGWVQSREEKKEAERCVEYLIGVNDVKNELHMKNRRLSS
jgi:BON domain